MVRDRRADGARVDLLGSRDARGPRRAHLGRHLGRHRIDCGDGGRGGVGGGGCDLSGARCADTDVGGERGFLARRRSDGVNLRVKENFFRRAPSWSSSQDEFLLARVTCSSDVLVAQYNAWRDSIGESRRPAHHITGRLTKLLRARQSAPSESRPSTDESVLRGRTRSSRRLNAR